MCEQKPSGRINVPQEVHERWAQGGDTRKALLAELEAADWDKECVHFLGVQYLNSIYNRLMQCPIHCKPSLARDARTASCLG